MEHFRREETYVFPLATRYVPDGGDLITELKSEHRKLEGYIRTLQDYDEDLEEVLLSFARLLEQHIRREERILFQELQTHVPESVLAETGRFLKES